MCEVTTVQEQAGRRRGLSYLIAAAALAIVLLMAFAPPILVFGAGISSAVAWCCWLDTRPDDQQNGS